MTAVYELFARDANLDRVAQIDDFTSAELVLRHNRPGSWRVNGIPASGVGARFTPGAGIVVHRDGTAILSGPVTLPARRWSAAEDHVNPEGVGDLIHLWDRIAHPSPADGNFATQAYDVRTDVCETVLHEYVNVNAGPGALTARRATGLTLGTDNGAGASVTGRARLQILGDFLAGLAIAGGDLGFQIVQSGSGIVFSVTTTTDKSDTVVFSAELGNLLEYAYDQRAPEASYVYVGGGGEGAARTFREGGDSAATARWGRRIERFVDQRQTTVTAELDQARDENLATAAEQTTLVLTPTETGSMAYGVDYGLGDRVSAVVDGVAVDLVVREVRITLDGDGETVTPVLATPQAPTPTLDLFSRMRRLDARLRNVEGR